MYKKGWKQVYDERIKRLYNEVIAEAKRKGYFSDGAIPDLYERESIRFLGRCVRKETFNGFLDCAIVLNSAIFKYSDFQILDTIIHEVGHALTPGEHHSERWKRISDKIGERWGITVSRLCADEQINKELLETKKEKRERTEYKYELFCPICGKVLRQYKSLCDAVKNPEQWRHKKDKGILQSRKIESITV